MTKLETILNKFDKLLIWMASITLLIMTLWISTDVIVRSFFNSPIPGTTEITGEYFMVIIVYLALSYTQKNNRHVRVTLLEENVSQKWQDVVQFITKFLGSLLFLLIGVLNFSKGLDYIERNMVSEGILDYPLAPALFVISAGTFILFIRLILDCLLIILKRRSQTF